MSATKPTATIPNIRRQTEDKTTSILDDIVERMGVLETKQSRPSPVHLRTWEEIERFADKAARTDMVPKDFKGRPDAICIAVQMGSELGLAPMQSLINISVINGRPSVWGDALPGLVRASGVCEYIREWNEGDVYICEAKRRDDPNPVRASFSDNDATKAGLLNKPGPWSQYRNRMKQMRARGFALRDAFPDVLKGLMSAEEASDIPFSDTGLTPTMPTPPVATDQPITQREVVGRMMDNFDQGEAKRPTPETNSLAPLEEGDSRLWLRNLEIELANAPTMDAVVAIGDHHTVKNALANAPILIQGIVNDRLKDAYARFADETDTKPKRIKLAMPKAASGGVIWPEYARRAEAELAELNTAAEVDEWEEINSPTYNQRAIEGKLKRLVSERREAVSGESHAQPVIPYEIGDVIAWYGRASLQAISTLASDTDYLKWFGAISDADKVTIAEAREARLQLLRLGA